MSRDFEKNARKIRKMAEIIISGICAKFHSFISFFQSCPYPACSRARKREALDVEIGDRNRAAKETAASSNLFFSRKRRARA